MSILAELFSMLPVDTIPRPPGSFNGIKARILMRTLAPLTEAELAEVQKVAQRFANRHLKASK
jgi:hypothetical protein